MDPVSVPVEKFRQRENPDFKHAVIGAGAMIAHLYRLGVEASALQRIEGACDVAFAAHDGQVRPDGQPYVNHLILVAQVLVEKFGITDPNAVVAAILHDTPEDRALLVNKIMEGVASDSPARAINVLSSTFGASPREVRTALQMVTSPNFREMTLSLKQEAWNEELTQSHAHDLVLRGLHEQGQLGGAEEVCEMIKAAPLRKITNLLYLGHWSKLLQGDLIGRAVKLADFYTNGLHRHILLKRIKELPAGSYSQSTAFSFYEQIGEKYAPVVLLLERKLSQARELGIPLVNPKADAVLTKRIEVVKPYYSNYMKTDR